MCVSSSVKKFRRVQSVQSPVGPMTSWAVGSWPGLQHGQWLSSSEQAWHLTRKQLGNPFQSQHTGSTPSKTKTLFSVFWLPSSSCLFFMVPLSLEGDDGDASPRAGHSLALSICQLGVSVLTMVCCMGKLLCHSWGESSMCKWTTAHVWMTFGLVCLHSVL